MLIPAAAACELHLASLASMHGCCAPCARGMRAAQPAASRWCRRRQAVRAHLRARVALPLAPPTNARREAHLTCHCTRCTRCAVLARLLADPQVSNWSLEAHAVAREHIEGTVRQSGCDLQCRTDTRGRPCILVSTKTQASFERRAAQRRQDLADLQLPG